MEKMNTKQEQYFQLRYKERITRFSDIGKKENLLNPQEVYSSIDEYYLMKLGLDNKLEIPDKLDEIKKYFKDYKEYYDLYFNEDRELFFSNPIELVKWFTDQNKRCGYCYITSDELQKIIEIRNVKKEKKTLTLNGKKKRSKGTLEIERLTPLDEYTPDNGYSFENCILACPLCNNAKSNLIDEAGWKKYFVGPMQEYYESILGKQLKFRK